MSLGLALEEVSKAYRTGHQTTAVLAGVTLSVPPSEFVSIMGPSGSGKSTLLNLIAGLDTPTFGRILIGDRDMASLSDDDRSDFRLKRMGFVFQSFNLLPTLDVVENIMWPLEFLGRSPSKARARAREMLAVVELPERTHERRPADLSGGEQQRVAVARALATEPELLLADEPTGNLDTRNGEMILDLLRRLAREHGVTVLMVTHNPLAATYGDRTIELRDGRVTRDVRAADAPRAQTIPFPGRS
jgi:putative ABC transport system ATP-binding protein